MEKTPFKHCPKCHKKYAKKDIHDVCNLCFEDAHDEDGCEACKEFVPKTEDEKTPESRTQALQDGGFELGSGRSGGRGRDG